MTARRKTMLAAVLLWGCALLPAYGQDNGHPRLFVSPERITQVQKAAARPGTHHHEAFEAMRARVDQHDWRVYDTNAEDGNWNYARSHLAREAALVYLLTREQKYAQLAYEALHAIHADPDPDARLPERGYGLARAMTGLGFAIAYDWAYHGWTPEQRAYVRAKIVRALDAWPDYRHANLETPHQGSNWVAVCRAGELIMMLALYEENHRAERYAFLKASLEQHLETAYGPSGWSQEGIGYTSYAGQFLLPALYALESVGDDALQAAFKRMEPYRLAMATGAFTPAPHHLMSGVDNGFAYDNQGWASLLLHAVPRTMRGYYRFFYDRYIGRASALPPGQRYDPHRAGTTWALLYYPEEVPTADPDGQLPPALFDEEKGVYLFRSRWEDERDVLVSMMGDYHHHGNAWDIEEAFQIGLIVGGVPLVGGPGKQGTGSKATSEGYSTLLVNGRAFSGAGRTGAPVAAEASASGGYVVVDGGSKYAGLGLTAARRHFLVDFGRKNDVVLSTLDRLQSDTSRTLTWQLNVGGPDPVPGLQVEGGQEAGRAVFTVRGPGNIYLKGWVLHPAEAKVSAEDPIRVSLDAAEAEIWVAMTAGQGTPPRGRVTGSGLESQLYIEDRVMVYDPSENRVQLHGDKP